MKRFIYILLLGSTLMFNSCSEGTDPLYFVTVEREFEINAGLNTILTHVFQLKAVPTFFNENLALHNRTLDDVTGVSPGDATMTAVFGNLDWTFVERVEVYAVSRLDPSVRERMFFTNGPDFGNRNEVKMFNTFVDLKEIFSEGLIDVEVGIKTRSFVPGNIQATLIFNYAVFDEI